MPDPVAAQRTKTASLRSRVIAHHKAGQKAPRLTKAYNRARADLALLLRRKRRQEVQAGPRKALAWARSKVGISESPAGSNRNPKSITLWQTAFASWLVSLPWCGVYVGTALRAAGVKVTPRVASVALIEDDARAGRNGFEKLVSIDEARPGDVLILFGRGVHTEMIESIDRKRRRFNTFGGNTSSGNAGSQSNGGAVAYRHGATARPFAQVHAIARPAYPKH